MDPKRHICGALEVYIHFKKILLIFIISISVHLIVSWNLCLDISLEDSAQSKDQKSLLYRRFVAEVSWTLLLKKQQSAAWYLLKPSFCRNKKKKILQGPIIWLATQGWHWILGDIMKRPSFCSKQIGTAVMIIVIIMSIINKWQCILLALGAWVIWQAACCTLSHNNDIHCQPRKFT